jgi:hypothetical protein
MERVVMSDSKRIFGRPLKGKDRRVSIAVYVTGSTVDTIDEYVMERQQTQRTYSRSDFFNEALEKHMKDLGIIGDDNGEKEQG